MLGRDTNKSMFPIPPTEDEILDFENDASNGPTVDYFRIDFSSASSPWNKALAKVFAAEFIDRGWYKAKVPESDNEFELIRSYFLTHLKQLFKQNKELSVGLNEETLRKLRLNARKYRRRTVGAYI